MLWYALQTHSNYEKRVEAELSRKQIETYLPLFEEQKRWADRQKLIEIPVFRSYLFARFETENPRSRLSVIETTGVCRILGVGEIPEPIPEAEIQSIRTMLENSRCAPHPFLNTGDLVRVTRGALKDVEGILLRVKSETRLVVSVEMLSRSVSTEIDAADVELVKRSPALKKAA